MGFGKSKIAAMAAWCFACATPHVASAEAGLAQQGDVDTQIAALPTGDQLVLQDYDGTIRFAGRDIALVGFSGVVGHASESAYLLTFAGRASTGALEAETGRMLMLQPFGRGGAVTRFDARRLHQTLAEQIGAEGDLAMDRLAAIADSQDRGVFFGRLGRTNFNVATMGSTSAEAARRERVGHQEIREARFVADGSDVERSIVSRFVAALAAGDADAVAAYLDPLPYGGGSVGAREAMARQLIARHDWRVFVGASPERAGDTGFTLNSAGKRAAITLRRTTDFAFVQSIQVGE